MNEFVAGLSLLGRLSKKKGKSNLKGPNGSQVANRSSAPALTAAQNEEIRQFVYETVAIWKQHRDISKHESSRRGTLYAAPPKSVNKDLAYGTWNELDLSKPQVNPMDRVWSLMMSTASTAATAFEVISKDPKLQNSLLLSIKSFGGELANIAMLGNFIGTKGGVSQGDFIQALNFVTGFIPPGKIAIFDKLFPAIREHENLPRLQLPAPPPSISRSNTSRNTRPAEFVYPGPPSRVQTTPSRVQTTPVFPQGWNPVYEDPYDDPETQKRRAARALRKSNSVAALGSNAPLSKREKRTLERERGLRRDKTSPSVATRSHTSHTSSHTPREPGSSRRRKSRDSTVSNRSSSTCSITPSDSASNPGHRVRRSHRERNLGRIDEEEEVKRPRTKTSTTSRDVPRSTTSRSKRKEPKKGSTIGNFFRKL